MSPELMSSLSIFVLALLVGFEVISRIPTTLHTPMMSGANSIHGVIVVGAVVLAVTAGSPLAYILLFFAAAFAAMNVAGGYVVTDRMLQMFKKRPEPRGGGAGAAGAARPAGVEGKEAGR